MPQNCARRGWVKGQPFKFVLGHNARKLTVEQIAEIRARPWDARAVLAAEFGVSTGAIDDLRNGRRSPEIVPNPEILSRSQEARAEYLAERPRRNAIRRARIGRRWSERNPEAAAAQIALSNALRDGVLKKGACVYAGEECSDSIEGHHADYSKPLDVEWMCTKHHGMTRRKHVGCRFEGCERSHKSRGWCGLHYARVMRTGDPGPLMPVRQHWPRRLQAAA